MSDTLELKPFSEIDLADPFFSSLKHDYKTFTGWFHRKASEKTSAFIQKTDNVLTGFIYLKPEEGALLDVTPIQKPDRRLKIGTFKTEAHGTKLGERLLKKAFDTAIVLGVNEIYVTVFPKYDVLIKLFNEFGFKQSGEKHSTDGDEIVLTKSLLHDKLTGDLREDYPMINTRKSNFYLLGIYPQWHSQLFPDSILKTETYDLLSDVSYTNSISKTYICWISEVQQMRSGDILVIYRTREPGRSAEYSSVATSICTVEEVRTKPTFPDMKNYIEYAQPYSVFNASQLDGWWHSKNLTVTKMLYNAALTKRLVRRTLADEVGLDRHAYAGFMTLTKNQFLRIAELGGVSDRLIVH